MGTLVLIIFIVVVVGLIMANFHRRGKKILSIFPSIDSVNVRFRDKQATGYADKTLASKLGGSSGVVDVVVTDEELWLKCSPLYAGLKERSAMIYKVPLKQVNVTAGDRKVTVSFKLDGGSKKKVMLITSNNSNFIEAVKRKK